MATEDDPCAALHLACKYAMGLATASLEQAKQAVQLAESVCQELQDCIDEHGGNPPPLPVPESQFAQPAAVRKMPTVEELNAEIKACRRLASQIDRFVMR